MKSVKVLKFALVCSFALACIACSQLTGNSSQSGDSSGQSNGSGQVYTAPSLKTVGFVAVNMPNDKWLSTSAVKPSLVYDFSLVFEGTISRSDFVSAKIYQPNSTAYWSFNLDDFDPADKSISKSSCYYGTRINELPIGTMKAQVTLTNGTVLEKSFTMGFPGSTTNGIYNYVYNADETSSPSYPSTSAIALRRPVIVGLGISSSKITVNFTARDTRIHNGIIWLYSSDESYIGSSPKLRDGNTGKWFSGLNSGNGLYTGTTGTNSMVLANGDVFDSNGNVVTAVNFSRIARARARVMAVDGLQYETSTSYDVYDYEAISAMY